MKPSTRDLTVIVPVRNGEEWIGRCLEAIAHSRPAETIVVDGLSTDRTVELARAQGARVISDEGQGVAAARHLGAEGWLHGPAGRPAQRLWAWLLGPRPDRPPSLGQEQGLVRRRGDDL